MWTAATHFQAFKPFLVSSFTIKRNSSREQLTNTVWQFQLLDKIFKSVKWSRDLSVNLDSKFNLKMTISIKFSWCFHTTYICLLVWFCPFCRVAAYHVSDTSWSGQQPVRPQNQQEKEGWLPVCRFCTEVLLFKSGQTVSSLCGRSFLWAHTHLLHTVGLQAFFLCSREKSSVYQLMTKQLICSSSGLDIYTLLSW